MILGTPYLVFGYHSPACTSCSTRSTGASPCSWPTCSTGDSSAAAGCRTCCWPGDVPARGRRPRPDARCSSSARSTFGPATLQGVAAPGPAGAGAVLIVAAAFAGAAPPQPASTVGRSRRGSSSRGVRPSLAGRATRCRSRSAGLPPASAQRPVIDGPPAAAGPRRPDRVLLPGRVRAVRASRRHAATTSCCAGSARPAPSAASPGSTTCSSRRSTATGSTPATSSAPAATCCCWSAPPARSAGTGPRRPGPPYSRTAGGWRASCTTASCRSSATSASESHAIAGDHGLQRPHHGRLRPGARRGPRRGRRARAQPRRAARLRAAPGRAAGRGAVRRPRGRGPRRRRRRRPGRSGTRWCGSPGRPSRTPSGTGRPGASASGSRADRAGRRLVVQDDGQGFDSDCGARTSIGYGLTSMRDRAGACPGRSTSSRARGRARR